MSNHSITLDFNTIHSHEDLVIKLAPAYLAKKDEHIHVEINLNVAFLLYSDLLLLTAATIIHLRESGVKIKGKLIGFDNRSPKIRYASRVDFFEHIGFAFNEDFRRHSPSGRFTEIKKFHNDNAISVHEEIIKILVYSGNIKDDMLTVLDYCLWEVLDNVLNHSDGSFVYGKGTGYVCSQYFPKHQQIRIMVADTGVGIHKSLTTHPNSEHKNLNEKEAIGLAIEKDITNSLGQGFGLWATAEMIRKNEGKLILHSGNHQLKYEKDVGIKYIPTWKGTFVFLKINTNKPMSYNAIFGESSVQKDRFQEIKEELTEKLDDLW